MSISYHESHLSKLSLPPSYSLIFPFAFNYEYNAEILFCNNPLFSFRSPLKDFRKSFDYLFVRIIRGSWRNVKDHSSKPTRSFVKIKEIKPYLYPLFGYGFKGSPVN